MRDWHTRPRGLVLISHDLQLPAVLGGRVIALREGRIVADGDCEAVLLPERLAAIYDAAFESVETSTGQHVVLPAWWGEGAATRA